MRSSSVMLMCVVLMGCANGGRRTSEPHLEQTTRLQSREGTVELRTTRSDPSNEFMIAGTVDGLWRALPVVYAQLEVPVTMRVPAERAMGNRAFRARGRLGGTRLSRYLDCGNRMGLSNADSYEVIFRLETRVLDAVGDSTRLVTVVEGTARPVDVSGNPIACSTTGRLERRIVEMVTEQVGRG
ncbi:MAG: hypothetical protein ACYC2G_03135 [Gemmatimonadaceae bacterium]